MKVDLLKVHLRGFLH